MSTHRPNEADLSPNISPLSQLTPDEMEAIAEAEYQHVDYDLQPLRVQGLEQQSGEASGKHCCVLVDPPDRVGRSEPTLALGAPDPLRDLRSVVAGDPGAKSKPHPVLQHRHQPGCSHG